MARYMERAETRRAHARRHLPHVRMENVLDFMVFDETIRRRSMNCLRMARENAHAVRGTITSEMWETSTTPGWKCAITTPGSWPAASASSSSG
jgi:uncharacterized alpha-E superfamily protein